MTHSATERNFKVFFKDGKTTDYIAVTAHTQKQAIERAMNSHGIDRKSISHVA